MNPKPVAVLVWDRVSAREVGVEAGLVERAQSGDADAYEALAAGRIEGMVRTAMAIIGEEGEARDATQEALLSIWRELPSLRDPQRFEAWAGRILINRCRLSLRRRRRRDVREVPMPEAEPHGLAGGPTPEAAVVRRRTLESAFERLDAEARTLLVLHHLEGLSVAEMAEAMEVPVGTVKSRLFAARRDLDKALGAEA
ncbi:MAG: RNA polymerase sigma factor [Candidatus Limnocylindrales bacterium]